MKESRDVQPLLLERGISLNLTAIREIPITPSSTDGVENISAVPKPTLELAAAAVMARVAAEAQEQTGGKVQAVSMNEMRAKQSKHVKAQEVTA